MMRCSLLSSRCTLWARCFGRTLTLGASLDLDEDLPELLTWLTEAAPSAIRDLVRDLRLIFVWDREAANTTLELLCQPVWRPLVHRRSTCHLSDVGWIEVFRSCSSTK